MLMSSPLQIDANVLLMEEAIWQMLAKIASCIQVQGDPSAHGLGYVDINSVSYGGYPETKLMTT